MRTYHNKLGSKSIPPSANGKKTWKPVDFHPFSTGLFPDDYQAERVVSILNTFLTDMDFVPMGINPANKAVEDYMENLMYERGIQCKKLKNAIHLAASLVELGYNKCSVDEKTNLALFNWCAIYIDNGISEDQTLCREFISRIFTRQPQLDPVLNVFAEVLNRMWDFYDPLAVTFILSHTFNFLAANCIEQELPKIPLKHGIERFPWFIRNLTGLALAYALFAFVKSGNYDIMKVVQAFPDMNCWIALTNDLLSFHKEEIEGEKGTYIHNRAQNDNKSPYETCLEIVAELKQARMNIHAILADHPAALEAWKSWEIGYVEWHIGQNQRYHLEDIGFIL